MRIQNYIYYFWLASLWLFCLQTVHTQNRLADSLVGKNQKADFYNPLFMPKFAFTQKYEYRKGLGFSFDASAQVFGISASIKTETDLPKFRLNADGFYCRFSPLLYFDKKKLLPALSFYFGDLRISTVRTEFGEPKFSPKKTDYSGIKFLPKKFVSGSKTKIETKTAVEFSVKNFNAFLFMEEADKLSAFNYHLGFAYKNTEFEDIKFAVLAYAGLYPALYAVENSQQLYNQIYGGEFIFTGENETGLYKFLAAGSVNIPSGDNKNISESGKDKKKSKKLEPKKIACAGKLEFDYLGEYFGFNAGIGIKDQNFFGFTRKKQRENFIVFLQPKFLIGIFETKGIYNYTKENATKKTAPKKGAIKNDDKDFFHSGGVEFKVNDLKYVFSSGFYFHKEEWEVDSELQIKNLAAWQNLVSLKSGLVLEEKTKNPFVIQEYSVNAKFKIDLPFNFTGEIFGGIKQKNKFIKEKKTSLKKSRQEWQKKELNCGFAFGFSKKTKHCKHSVNAKIKFKNKKELFYFSLAYNLQSK